MQIDSTQDIAVQDQLAIVLRYVKSGIVREHLNRRIFNCCESLRHAEERTGNRQMKKDGLSFADVIGNSFDGAFNMLGAHSGLQAEIRKASTDSLYIHCYAHALRLVMASCTSDSEQTRIMFGI